jgi:hypothetical protein
VRELKFHFGCYMFGLNRKHIDKSEIIDATFRGNMARYLNHSCDVIYYLNLAELQSPSRNGKQLPSYIHLYDPGCEPKLRAHLRLPIQRING